MFVIRICRALTPFNITYRKSGSEKEWKDLLRLIRVSKLSILCILNGVYAHSLRLLMRNCIGYFPITWRHMAEEKTTALPTARILLVLTMPLLSLISECLHFVTLHQTTTTFHHSSDHQPPSASLSNRTQTWHFGKKFFVKMIKDLDSPLACDIGHHRARPYS